MNAGPNRSHLRWMLSYGLVRAAAVVAIFALSACQTMFTEAHYLARGKKLLNEHEYSRAVLEFKNASKLQPHDAEPYFQASVAYLAMGQYQVAYRDLVHATELNPKDAEAQKKLAELIESSIASTRDPQALADAEKRVQGALAIVPDNPEALGALGLTEYLMGKPDEAVHHLEAALAKFPQELQAARTLAVIRLNRKDYSGAERVLKEAAANSPKSVEAQVALATFYILNRRGSEAEAAYRKALQIDPGYGPALLDLARLQIATGRKDDAEKTLAALSALPDKRYRPFHAVFLFEQGRRDEAVREFEKQAKENLNDRAAFLRLTSAYFFTQRFPDAEKAINAALARDPKNTDALLEQSRLDLITAKFAEAESDLNQVVGLEPGSAVAHYLLSQVYRAQGKQLQREDQLGNAVRLDPNLLSARLDLAELLISQGNAKAAIEIMDQAPRSETNALALIVEQNWALLSLRRGSELKKNIERGLGFYKGAPDLLLQDGLLKLDSGDFSGSRKSLEAALSASPQEARAVDALAKTYVAQGQPRAALQIVQRYASQQPRSAPLQYLLGHWMAANGELDKAKTAFNAAVAADPSLVDAQVASAYLDISTGKLEAARQELTSIRGTPGTRLSCELGLAQIEEREGKPAAAVSHYQAALEIDPKSIPALNGLAYQLANESTRLDEALKYAQQALELAPNSGYTQDTLGWVLYRKGLYSSAVKYLQTAAMRRPIAVIKYHLAMAYLRAGDWQRGRQTFAEAAKLDSTLPEAAAARLLITQETPPAQ